jgi:hypothetical protein
LIDDFAKMIMNRIWVNQIEKVLLAINNMNQPILKILILVWTVYTQIDLEVYI